MPRLNITIEQEGKIFLACCGEYSAAATTEWAAVGAVAEAALCDYLPHQMQSWAHEGQTVAWLHPTGAWVTEHNPASAKEACLEWERLG